jgi:cytochrome c oxidase cbb3-type subunit IV
MELNDLRSIVTVAGLVLFLVLAVWTWMPSRRAAHDMAAHLPFEGEANEHDQEPRQ